MRLRFTPAATDASTAVRRTASAPVAAAEMPASAPMRSASAVSASSLRKRWPRDKGENGANNGNYEPGSSLREKTSRWERPACSTANHVRTCRFARRTGAAAPRGTVRADLCGVYSNLREREQEIATKELGERFDRPSNPAETGIDPR
jgi:hypothetical protein